MNLWILVQALSLPLTGIIFRILFRILYLATLGHLVSSGSGTLLDISPDSVPSRLGIWIL